MSLQTIAQFLTSASLLTVSGVRLIMNTGLNQSSCFVHFNMAWKLSLNMKSRQTAMWVPFTVASVAYRLFLTVVFKMLLFLLP